jgi:hypothetical protein
MDMNMEKIGEINKNYLENKKTLSEANKGFLYRGLWLIVNFGVVRDGIIRDVGPKAFIVFLVIRTFANKDFTSFPSLDTISRFSGFNVKTVQRQIKRLESQGWIRTEKSRRSDGRFENIRYKILERNYIRGTGEPSFLSVPVVKTTNGVQSQP